MIEYFSRPGLILVSGKFYSLRKKMYAFSLYRYDVCIYGGSTVGGELKFWSGRPRGIWYCIFPHSFCFLGANHCNIFYDCDSFGSSGEVFAHGGEFPLSFSIVVGLGHGVEYYCWPVTVVTVLKRAREGIRLVSSTMTVTCRSGLSA